MSTQTTRHGVQNNKLRKRRKNETKEFKMKRHPNDFKVDKNRKGEGKMKRKMNVMKVLLTAFVFASALGAFAAGPGTIVYSGKLLDSTGNVVNGNLDMTLTVYDAAVAGTALYVDRNTAGLGNPVTVTDGLYSVVIGDDAGGGGSYTTLKEALEASSTCHIEISIGGTALSPVKNSRQCHMRFLPSLQVQAEQMLHLHSTTWHL
jgi:hypothetical protein